MRSILVTNFTSGQYMQIIFLCNTSSNKQVVRIRDIGKTIFFLITKFIQIMFIIHSDYLIFSQTS